VSLNSAAEIHAARQHRIRPSAAQVRRAVNARPMPFDSDESEALAVKVNRL
jgi:hypothetical protein